MPLARFLRSLSGTCRYCGKQTGFLQRDHPECRQTHQAGFTEMVQLAAQAASAHTFNEAALRQTLQAIARRSRATGEDIEQALEEGFRQGVAQAMSDGIITRDEEERLRTFRDRLALEDSAADPNAIKTLNQASSRAPWPATTGTSRNLPRHCAGGARTGSDGMPRRFCSSTISSAATRRRIAPRKRDEDLRSRLTQP